MKLTVTAEDIEAGIAACLAGGERSQVCAVAQAFARYGIAHQGIGGRAWTDTNGHDHTNPAALRKFIYAFDDFLAGRHPGSDVPGAEKPEPHTFKVPDSWLRQEPA